MGRRRWRGVLVAVGALWAVVLPVGCGHGDVSRAGPATPSTASSSRATDPAARLKGPVSLTVSGGYAGVDRGIEVAPDGEVHVFDRKQHDTADPLTDAEVADLAKALDAIDFAKVPRSVVNRRAADLFHYRLTYARHTVLTDQSKPLGPVDDVIRRLKGYLDERTGRQR